MEKRLYRGRTNVMVSGVCGGIGQYLEIDPTLIRVFFALLTIVEGTGILLYVLLWVIVPLEPQLEDLLAEISDTNTETAKVTEEVIP